MKLMIKFNNVQYKLIIFKFLTVFLQTSQIRPAFKLPFPLVNLVSESVPNYLLSFTNIEWLNS